MTKHRDHLLHLLQASHQFLENPEDEEKWLAFEKALETVEKIEKAETRAAQAAELKIPTHELNQIRRQRYEAGYRPRSIVLLLGSLLTAVLCIGFMFYGIYGNGEPFAALMGDPKGKTPIIEPTVTPKATQTLTATLSATPSQTLTYTLAPIKTATDSPTPTMTASSPATLIPLMETGKITGQLTNDALSRQHIFRGQSGDVITITLHSQDFDPYLTILDPTGTELASDDDCGSLGKACIGPIQLESDGTYIIVVDSFTRRSTGAYILDIDVRRATATNAISDCSATLPRLVIITRESSIRLHSGPGLDYSVTGFVYNGECFAIVGRNTLNSWLQIRLPSGRRGWIAAVLTQVQGDLKSLPIKNS